MRWRVRTALFIDFSSRLRGGKTWNLDIVGKALFRSLGAGMDDGVER